MRRTNTIILMLLAINGFSQSDGGSNWQKPPVLPILLTWDTDGLNIHAENSVASASDMPFGLEISGDLQAITEDKIRVNETDFETPVYIELDPYFKKVSENQSKNMVKKEKPVIKINRKGVAKRVASLDRSFTLELKNYEGNKSQEFVVNGIDVFLIETKGSTKIEAYEKRIVIDVAESGVNQIMFRGGRLLQGNLMEKIPILCQSYNDKYKEDHAFTVEDTLLSPGTKWQLDHVRDLITKFNITDFRDESLAYLDEVIITKKGIGFNVRAGSFKRNGGWIKYSKGHTYKFFRWAKFINLEFEKYYDHKQIKIKGPYGNNYLFDGNPNFSNVELIQFLKELNYIISSNVK